jgi:tripartite-type tricarboxylate transporter receptor subunit TctC
MLLYRSIAALGAALAATLPLGAAAQQFPGKTITIVVPFSPGGAVDIIPRAMAPGMAERLGVPVIVENKPGAAGNVGAAYVSRAAPDGHTLLLFHSALFTVNPWLFEQLPFNPKEDLRPISDLASLPNVMVVNKDMPAKSIPELIKLVKSHPNKYNFGTPGIGTSSHLCMEFFKLRAGGPMEIVHVPFNSGPAAVTNLISNQVQVGCVAVNAAIPQIKADRLRPLAVTTLARSEQLPQVPTMDEAGLKGFEVTLWFGIAAPAKTPDAIVKALNAEVLRSLKEPAVIKRLETLGMSVLGSPPDKVVRHMSAESETWRTVIESAKVRLAK